MRRVCPGVLIPVVGSIWQAIFTILINVCRYLQINDIYLQIDNYTVVHKNATLLHVTAISTDVDQLL